MSRHPVQYHSMSKMRAFTMEELNPHHLVAARNKVAGWLEAQRGKDAAGEPDPQPDGSMRVLAALDAELKTRDLDPQYKGGMAPDDPRLAPGGTVQDKRERR